MARPAHTKRWLLGPLLDYVGMPLYGNDSRATLKCNIRDFYRWHQEGMSDFQADVAAMRFGVGPWEVWPEWFDVDPALLEAEAQASENMGRVAYRGIKEREAVWQAMNVRWSRRQARLRSWVLTFCDDSSTSRVSR